MGPAHAFGRRTLASLLQYARRHQYLFLLVLTVLAVDQASKLVVAHSLELRESFPAHGFFRFTYTYNTGSAFGLFSGQNTLLIVASFVGVGILTWFYRTQPNPGLLLQTSLGLQLGGAVGNLTDRLILGRVTDFIDVGPWPIFNLADSSIVIGVVLLVWVFVRNPGDWRTSTAPRSSAPERQQMDPPDD